MITLYQLPPAYDIPVSVSPFCAKVELYLRLRGRPFSAAEGAPFRSPNKMVPYVKWQDGEISADSEKIIERLESQGGGLDEGLAAKAKKRQQRLSESGWKR